ncbi:hypothetical protein [Haloechinothrix salitolerans]|uniref:Uncharacterized protein n=1 Tax=Haloechinothrix salitolerans TaxID=926830 RepID=A0ABW2C9H9_9PSEU
MFVLAATPALRHHIDAEKSQVKGSLGNIGSQLPSADRLDPDLWTLGH